MTCDVRASQWSGSHKCLDITTYVYQTIKILVIIVQIRVHPNGQDHLSAWLILFMYARLSKSWL